jgi:hypothetical protein
METEQYTCKDHRWVIKEASVEIIKFLESNENANTSETLRQSKAVLRWKFITMQNIRSQINNLFAHFKLLEKQE